MYQSVLVMWPPKRNVTSIQWGLFLLKWLFHTASTMQRREQQDQLMWNLHNELDQCLWRAGLHDTTSLGRSKSRGRACSHAPQWVHSSSWARLPSSEPTGKKALQPHSIGDVALHVPVDPHPQAPCRTGSISMLLPGSKGKLQPTHW